MADAKRYLGQALMYALFFLPLVYLTHQPQHRHVAEGMAVLKVAVRHAGAIIGECTPIAGAGTASRGSNLQQVEICPRERSPLEIQVLLNGETLYQDTVAGSGLHSDGVASMYQRFVVPSGKHHLELLLNDDVVAQGNTWRLEQDIELQPAQVMVATFKEGFQLQ